MQVMRVPARKTATERHGMNAQVRQGLTCDRCGGTRKVFQLAFARAAHVGLRSALPDHRTRGMNTARIARQMPDMPSKALRQFDFLEATGYPMMPIETNDEWGIR